MQKGRNLEQILKILAIISVCVVAVSEGRIRKKSKKSQFFFYDGEINIFGDTKSTPIQVSYIQDGEELIGAEIVGDESYGGKTFINFQNDALAIKLVSTGACGIYVPKRARMDFDDVLNDLKEQKLKAKIDKADVLPGAVCIVAGKLEHVSVYGSRLEALCRNLDKTNFLINSCRLTSSEEEETYKDKCFAGFVYVNGHVQLACIRHFIQPPTPAYQH